MKQSPFLLFILFLLIITIYTGCNNGGNDGRIPFSESRAAESVIPIEQARQYQRNFITGRDTLSRSAGAAPNFNLPNAESFTRDAIILLLNQENADGIRIYYGKDNAGMVRLVLLPVDKNGKDIQTTLIDRGQTNAISIPGIPGAYAAPPAEAQAIENGQTCPPCIID
jgi:hypothetical protein